MMASNWMTCNVKVEEEFGAAHPHSHGTAEKSDS